GCSWCLEAWEQASWDGWKSNAEVGAGQAPRSEDAASVVGLCGITRILATIASRLPEDDLPGRVAEPAPEAPEDHEASLAHHSRQQFLTQSRTHVEHRTPVGLQAAPQLRDQRTNGVFAQVMPHHTAGIDDIDAGRREQVTAGVAERFGHTLAAE